MMLPSTIDEDKSAHMEYGEGHPNGTSKTASIRISALPQQLHESALRMDRDGDGALNKSDIAMALHHLDNKERENRTLRTIVIGVVVVSVLLIASIFGASVAAARLSQEVTISADTGFAYVKGTHEIMKTEEAIEWENGSIGLLDTETLHRLSVVVLGDGAVRFKVFGSAMDAISGSVTLLVEGGTLSWDSEGLTDATGTARVLLESAMGSDALPTAATAATAAAAAVGAEATSEEGDRKLLSTCSVNYGFSPAF